MRYKRICKKNILFSLCITFEFNLSWTHNKAYIYNGSLRKTYFATRFGAFPLDKISSKSAELTK